MTLRAYDLMFGVEEGASYRYDGSPDAAVPNGRSWGWTGGFGPGIPTESWPRGTVTGLPMMHALTLWLPEEYRRRGSHLPAIAFFAGEGQFADPDSAVVPERDSGDPFLADLAGHRPHPQLQYRQDVIDGQFGLLWLTEAEFAAGPTRPPADPRRPGEHVADDEGTNAWDDLVDVHQIWLVDRPDPNAGQAPSGGGAGFEDPWNEVGLKPWAQTLYGRSHLGGTSFPVQALPEGLTPYYLEIEEIAGLNFGGGGAAQIDLESDTFDWACG